MTALCIAPFIVSAVSSFGLFAGYIITSVAVAPVTLTSKLAECCGIANQGTAFRFRSFTSSYGALAGGVLGLLAGGITGAAVSVAVSPLPFTLGLICGSVDIANGYYGRVDTLKQNMDCLLSIYKAGYDDISTQATNMLAGN